MNLLCSKCDIVKSIDNFYIKRKDLDRLNLDNYDNRCKNCRRLYRKSPRGREVIKKYEKSDKGRKAINKYKRSKSGQISIKKYQQSAKGIVTRNKAIKKYNLNNKNKLRARDAVRNEMRRGRLIKPNICSICKQNPGPMEDGKSRLQAHHYFGYDKENWLKFEWLCIDCHIIEEANDGKKI